MENFFHFSLQKPFKVVLYLGEVVLNLGEVVLASRGLGFVDTCCCTTDHSIPALIMYSTDGRQRIRETLNLTTDADSITIAMNGRATFCCFT